MEAGLYCPEKKKTASCLGPGVSPEARRGGRRRSGRSIRTGQRTCSAQVCPASWRLPVWTFKCIFSPDTDGWEWKLTGWKCRGAQSGAGFYRYFCRPSIIVSGQHWGVHGRAWLKARMPPDLLPRRRVRREDWLPGSISLPLLLYSCAIWFTGFCSVFPLHYLDSTGGASEFCMFHTSLQLLLWVWGIVLENIMTGHPFPAFAKPDSGDLVLSL